MDGIFSTTGPLNAEWAEATDSNGTGDTKSVTEDTGEKATVNDVSAYDAAVNKTDEAIDYVKSGARAGVEKAKSLTEAGWNMITESGAPNNAEKNTINDASITDDIGNESLEKVVNAYDAAFNGIDNVVNDVKPGVQEGVEKGKLLTDSATTKTSAGVESVWDHTKDTAEKTTNSALHIGSDIIDAVKSGAEAGWNMVTGKD